MRCSRLAFYLSALLASGACGSQRSAGGSSSTSTGGTDGLTSGTNAGGAVGGGSTSGAATSGATTGGSGGGLTGDTSGANTAGSTSSGSTGTTTSGGATVAGGSTGTSGGSSTAPCTPTNDADGDGYHAVGSCQGANDCDDGNRDVFPGAGEQCDDQVDNNCNLQVDGVDPLCPVGCADNDGDGYPASGCGGSDCNDVVGSVHPGAAEICGDGIDNNCNQLSDASDAQCPAGCVDNDGDGFLDKTCGGSDCDDGNDARYPGATEQCSDQLDNNCDDLIDSADTGACPSGCSDSDGDGFPSELCGGTDCNDASSVINPNQTELCSDSIDNNCNGGTDRVDPACYCPDVDGDGFAAATCGGPDCDDSAGTGAAFVPGGSENCTDGVDNNCNQATDGADPACTVAGVTQFPDATSCLTGGALSISASNLRSDTQVVVVRSGLCTTNNITTCVQTLAPEDTIPVASTTVVGDSLTIRLSSTVCASGFFDVFLINPGQPPAITVVESSLLLSVDAAPTLTDVSPRSSFTGPSVSGIADSLITLRGSGFTATPSIQFIKISSPGVSFLAEEVNFFSSTQLQASVPSESQRMPAGGYHVRLVNPDGQGVLWRHPTTGAPLVFTITSTAPPRIFTVSRTRAKSNESGVSISITGSGFRNATVGPPPSAGSQILLVREQPDGSLSECPPIPTVVLDDENIGASGINIASYCGGLAIGSYPLRIKNPDGQFADFFVFTITPNSDGHIAGYADVTGASGPALLGDSWSSPTATQRSLHTAIAGFDEQGSGYIYVMGGVTEFTGELDPSALQSQSPSGSVETLPVSVFGRVGQPFYPSQYDVSLMPSINGRPERFSRRQVTQMNTPRMNHSSVRVGRYLYAIGGRTGTMVSSTTTGSIERAEILRSSSAPSFLSATAEIPSGSLPAGKWFYRIAAVTPHGETLASRERVVATAAAHNVVLQWQRVADASAYLIFRSPAPNGRSQSARLIAEVAQSSGHACTTLSGDVIPGLSCLSLVDDGVIDSVPGVTARAAPAPARVSARAAVPGTTLRREFAVATLAAEPGQSCVAPSPGSGVCTIPSGCYVSAPSYTTATLVPSDPTVVTVQFQPSQAANVRGFFLYQADQTGALRCVAFESAAASSFSVSSLQPNTPSLLGSTPASSSLAPLPRGSLSKFAVLPQSLITPREGHRSLALDLPSGSSVRRTFIYTVGGRTTPTNYLNSTERTEVLVLGELRPLQYECQDATDPSPTCASSGIAALRQPRANFIMSTNIGRNDGVLPPPPGDPTEGGTGGGTSGGGGTCPNPDLDGDGFASVACGGCDCDDQAPNINCGEADICGNQIAENCVADEPCNPCTLDADQNGQIDSDNDGDGYNASSCCAQAPCDCNDANSSIHPNGLDICGNQIAEDCVADAPCTSDPCVLDADGNNRPDGDNDGDGYNSIACCPSLLTCGGVCDCNDDDATINPGVIDVCDSGVAENCCQDRICSGGTCTPTANQCTPENFACCYDGEGRPYSDIDGDGYIACSSACGAALVDCGERCDCDDNNPFDGGFCPDARAPAPTRDLGGSPTVQAPSSWQNSCDSTKIDIGTFLVAFKGYVRNNGVDEVVSGASDVFEHVRLHDQCAWVGLGEAYNTCNASTQSCPRPNNVWCSPSQPCAPGLVCTDSVCTGCAGDADCPGSLTCVGGACVGCAQDLDCGSGVCRQGTCRDVTGHFVVDVADTPVCGGNSYDLGERGDCLNNNRYRSGGNANNLCANSAGHFCFRGWEEDDDSRSADDKVAGADGGLMGGYFYTFGGTTPSWTQVSNARERVPYCPMNAPAVLSSGDAADCGQKGSSWDEQRPDLWDSNNHMVHTNKQSTSTPPCERAFYPLVTVYSYSYMIGGIKALGPTLPYNSLAAGAACTIERIVQGN